VAHFQVNSLKKDTYSPCQKKGTPRLNDALWAFRKRGSSIERESVNDANGSGNRFLRAHNSFISLAFFDSKKG
jgi:hypothetical protein